LVIFPKIPGLGQEFLAIYRSKTEIFLNNRNFCQKSKRLLKTDIFVKHRNFCQNSIFCQNSKFTSKLEILIKDRIFCQNSKFSSKLQMFHKNWNFCQNSKFFVKNRIFCQNWNFCQNVNFCQKSKLGRFWEPQLRNNFNIKNWTGKYIYLLFVCKKRNEESRFFMNLLEIIFIKKNSELEKLGSLFFKMLIFFVHIKYYNLRDPKFQVV